VRLETFEPDYGDFYVPAFTAKVDDQDLVRDLFMAVTRVQVTMKEKAAADFSITVASAFSWTTGEFFAMRGEEAIDLIELFRFGASVKLALGYGEPAKLLPMIEGLVTRIGTSFTENGTPELTISGFDKLHPLTIGQETRHWENQLESDVVADIAGRHNLDAIVTATSEVMPRIDQSQQSDFAFLNKLAERLDCTFYVRGNTLHFGPRRRDAPPTVELEWGRGLSSFSPTANIAKQVTRVVVCGRSESGEQFEGVAERGDEADTEARRDSGAGRIAQALGREPVLRVRAAVRNQAEATARARAIFNEHAQDLVTGDGECVGLPEIMPDSNIMISGVGRAFSKTYYVAEATHSLDTGGYRTRFGFREMLV
jgi:phage protein D